MTRAGKSYRNEIYTHRDIGDIRVNRSGKAKRISITVRSTEVVLTIPFKLSTASALEFLDTRIEWIVKNKQRLSVSNQIILPPFSTRLFDLNVFDCVPGAEHFYLEKGKINVFVSVSLESEISQEMIKNAVACAYDEEAPQFLPQRVNRLALYNGFTYNKLSFRRSYTRWGSCSTKNNITLSTRIMKLPDHLIDYIILHELCHTKHKNHGHHFYELLNKISSGNHKALNYELKKYTTR